MTVFLLDETHCRYKWLLKLIMMLLNAFLKLFIIQLFLLYFFVSDMTAGQLHETLKQRVLQLSDQDQIEILSNIEVNYFHFML